MKLRTLLNLQVSYFTLGILYNAVSLLLTVQGKPPLASTQPVMGMISMTVYAFCLIPGFLHKTTLYRVLMGLAVVWLGYGGIVVHIINIFTNPQLYSSVLAWAGAVGINVYGLVLNVIGVSGKFKAV